MKKATRFYLVAVTGVLVAGAIMSLLWLAGTRPTANFQISGKTYQVKIVDTVRARERGLAGRASLPADEGMLFVFDQPGGWSFWMKGMKLPIDIIWLDADKRVVHIERAVQPDQPPHRSYSPGEDALYVLEVGANQSDGVHLGDRAKFDIVKAGR